MTHKDDCGLLLSIALELSAAERLYWGNLEWLRNRIVKDRLIRLPLSLAHPTLRAHSDGFYIVYFNNAIVLKEGDTCYVSPGWDDGTGRAIIQYIEESTHA